MFKKIPRLYRKKMWKPERYARHIGVTIGDNCYIATKDFSSEPYLITIGNHVQITSDVKFFPHSGGWVFREEFPGFDTFGKIIIKDNVYIGNNVLILPGVTIGNNVVIGAGAIVTKSFSDGVVIAGNPARVIKTVDELKHSLLPYNVNSKEMSHSEKKKYLLGLDDDKFINK